MAKKVYLNVRNLNPVTRDIMKKKCLKLNVDYAGLLEKTFTN